MRAKTDGERTNNLFGIGVAFFVLSDLGYTMSLNFIGENDSTTERRQRKTAPPTRKREKVGSTQKEEEGANFQRCAGQ